jgi:hypothetical protein
LTQLLNIHKVSNVSKIEIHTAEPLVTDPSPFDYEIAIAKFKKHKSPGSDQTLAELIQAGGETLQSGIHKLINCIWNKEELPDQWKESCKYLSDNFPIQNGLKKVDVFHLCFPTLL